MGNFESVNLWQPCYITIFNNSERVDEYIKFFVSVHFTKSKFHDNFRLQPKVVSDVEEMELAKHLERLEEQNREVSGDEGSESSDEEGSEEEGEKNKTKDNGTNDAEGDANEDDEEDD